MPCMGPDLKEARTQGQEVGAKLLARLIDENKLWDITDKAYNEKFLHFPNSENRWDKAKKEFVRAVEELFVEDACNGF